MNKQSIKGIIIQDLMHSTSDSVTTWNFIWIWIEYDFFFTFY